MPASPSRICRFAFLVLVFLGTVQAGAQPWSRRPDAVVGQVGIFRTTPNFIDGRGLRQPQEIAVDTSVVPNRLYVYDVRNNRVLGWRDAADRENGAPADLVIGQPNPFEVGCNSRGISRGSLCSELVGPFWAGLAVDGSGNLYVADADNFRILEFDSPFTSDTLADRVFLATDFTSRGCQQAGPPPPCNVSGLAVDRAGNLYVSDLARGVFVYLQPLTTDTVFDRQIGQLSTSACTTPDASSFCNLRGIALDGADNLYTTDISGRVLVFRSPLTTDGVADLVLGQPDFATLPQCTGSDPGPLPADRLCAPTAVAVDAAGNVWVVDNAYHRVLGYNSPLETDAVPDHVLGKRGSFTSGENSCNGLPPTRDLFCLPRGVAIDSRGGVWVADSPFNRVLRFSMPRMAGALPDLVLGQVGFVHGAENLVDGRGFFFPAAIAVDRASSPPHVYVLDAYNHRVLGWRDAEDLAAGLPADLVLGQPDLFSQTCNNGGVSARSLCFTNVFETGGLAVDGAGNLYVSDTFNHRILEFDLPFTTDTVADEVFGQKGSFTSRQCNNGGVSAGSLCSPLGLAVDRQGNLYVADAANHRVLLFNQPLRKDTVADRVFGTRGSFRRSAPTPPVCRGGRDFLCIPEGLALDGAGNLYVADAGNSRVLEYDQAARSDGQPDRVFGQRGTFTGLGCGVGQDRLCYPAGITITPSGALYVVSRGSRLLVRYPEPLRKPRFDMAIQGFVTPTAVAVDPAGNVYVTDGDGNRVLVFENP
jgi:DNA-binding beta-propeller fold protein YncE